MTSTSTTVPDLTVPWRSVLGREAGLLGRYAALGGLLGVLSCGVLMRLVMSLLAKLNPGVRGVVSDDGFVIGQVTLSGSLSLAVLGAFFGALSGLLYGLLQPLQLGPGWFRLLSISVGGGTVVGASIVHSDGVDFTFLDPPLLAIVLFVAIPVLHVLVLDLLGAQVRAGRLLRGRAWPWLGALGSVPVAPFAVLVLAVRFGVAWAQAQVPPRLPGAVLEVSSWAARCVLAVLFVLAVQDLVRDTTTLV